MNQTLETIANRRSVRSFADKPIPTDMLEQIIKAGTLAPTGANSQLWRFVVITSPDIRKKFADIALPHYKQWLKNAGAEITEMRREIDASTADPVYYNAPVIIFVIGQEGMTREADCPMACENIMLAARSLGIGSCWVFFGQFVLGDPDVRQLLELKEEEKVYGPLLLGYPKGDFPPSPPKKEPIVKFI